MEVPSRFHRFFIALIPPEPIRSEIHSFKEELSEKFMTRAALRSPPHITLHMPFLWPKKSEQRLLEAISSLSAGLAPVEVHLRGFGNFSPRVIFIAVENDPALLALQRAVSLHCRRSLNILNADYKETPFHPHITIAFRDLKKQVFQQAWNSFEHREFRRDFKADSLHLLKHNGKVWETYKEFRLGSE